MEREDMQTTIESEEFINAKDIRPQPVSLEQESSIYVVFTSMDGTLKALEKAREMAKPFDAAIIVIAVEVVPFPLPIDKPPVPMEFVLRSIEEKADEFPERTRVIPYLCRNAMDAFKCILTRNSPVIIGVKKSWLPSRDERLANRLHRAGYNVTLVKTE
jgi:hypothetical protein